MGVDPGTTTGIAILDLEGGLVDYRSRKEFSKSDIREFIISHGKPVVVAGDVNPAPSLVEKLAATFSAELYYPEEDLSVEEKERLTEKYDIDADSHSRDALAAAVDAYNSTRSVLERIKDKSEEMDVEKEEVVEKFFRKGGSVHQIARGLQEQEIVEEEPTESGVDRNWKEVAEDYREKLKRKEKEIERLREYKDSLEEELEEVEEEKEELEKGRKKEIQKSDEVDKWRSRAKNRENTIHKLEEDLEDKREKIGHLRTALKKSYRDMELVPIMESRSDIAGADESIIAVRGGKVKPASEVKVVIIEEEGLEEFYRDRGVQVVSTSEIECFRTEDFYLVRKDEIDQKLEEKSDNFIDWLENYRDRG